MSTPTRFLLAGAFIISFSIAAIAQSQSAERSIKVFGTAEMEIVPDEIYVSITLSEFIKDKKKTTIEELEKGLLNYLSNVISVKRSDIKMNDMDAALVKKKRSKEEIITISYDIKLNSLSQLYRVYGVMDSLSIDDAHVRKYSHSKMDELKKQVKINAIKAAKEKASYLLEAIGSKAGRPLLVTENSGLVTVETFLIDETGISNNEFRPFRGNVLRGGSWKSAIEPAEERIDKTIKISYEIEAAFEILP